MHLLEFPYNIQIYLFFLCLFATKPVWLFVDCKPGWLGSSAHTTGTVEIILHLDSKISNNKHLQPNIQTTIIYNLLTVNFIPALNLFSIIFFCNFFRRIKIFLLIFFHRIYNWLYMSFGHPLLPKRKQIFLDENKVYRENSTCNRAFQWKWKSKEKELKSQFHFSWWWWKLSIV